MTLPLIIPHTGVLIFCKNPRRKVGRCLDVTFTDEICEVGETQKIYITDELDRSFKQQEWNGLSDIIISVSIIEWVTGWLL